MKITKGIVAVNAFNVFAVLGFLISATGPVNEQGSTLFMILRIGLPIALGIVGGTFMYTLLTWCDEAKNRINGKADSED